MRIIKKILLLTATLLILVGCSKGNPMESYPDVGKDNNFESMSYQKIVDKMLNYEEGIYFAGYPGCEYCTKLAPVLNDLLEETGKTAYYLDVSSDEFATDAVVRKFQQFDESLPEDKRSEGMVPFVVVINKFKDAQTTIGFDADIQARLEQLIK